jgi:hypothetical protein
MNPQNSRLLIAAGAVYFTTGFGSASARSFGLRLEPEEFFPSESATSVATRHREIMGLFPK